MLAILLYYTELHVQGKQLGLHGGGLGVILAHDVHGSPLSPKFH